MRCLPLTLGALAALAAAAPAQQSITTLFAGGNGGSAGWMNYFDITVNVGLQITQLDLNISSAAGTAGTIDVYLTGPGGTYVGNQLNAAPWTLMSSSASFAAAGSGAPTPAILTTPIVLAPGTYGVAILFNGVGMSYTNGSGANQTYSNPEMTLNFGSSTAGVFSSTLFDPRVWNGTIHYFPGNGYASAVRYGTGCGGGGPPGFYELFDGTANAVDLQGTAPGSSGVTMNAAGTIYVVTIGNGIWFTPTSPAIPFTDDQTQQITLPWAFPYQGGVTNDLWVCSNGWISLEATTDRDYTETVAELLSGPARVCPLWDDLNPSSGGSIHFDQDPVNPSTVYMTWVGVPEFSNTGANTFQVAFHQFGSIELRYQSLSAMDALVGFSPGNGAGDPGGVDISMIQAIPTGDGRDPLSLVNLAGSRPITGSVFNLEIGEIPQGTSLGALVFSLTQINPGIDLTSLGMPGCFQYLTLDGALAFATTGQAVPLSLTIPNDPNLAGLHLYYQAAAFTTGFNALGVISSNALDVAIDVQ